MFGLACLAPPSLPILRIDPRRWGTTQRGATTPPQGAMYAHPRRPLMVRVGRTALRLWAPAAGRNPVTGVWLPPLPGLLRSILWHPHEPVGVLLFSTPQQVILALLTSTARGRTLRPFWKGPTDDVYATTLLPLPEPRGFLLLDAARGMTRAWAFHPEGEVSSLGSLRFPGLPAGEWKVCGRWLVRTASPPLVLTPSRVLPLMPSGAPGRLLALHPRLPLAVLAGDTDTVVVRDFLQDRVLLRVQGPRGVFWDALPAAWDPDGARLALALPGRGSRRPEVRVFDLNTGEEAGMTPEEDVTEMRWLRNGYLLVRTVTRVLLLRRHDPADLHLTARCPARGTGHVHPTAPVVLVSGDRGTHLLTPAGACSGAPFVLRGEVAWSPDGRRGAGVTSEGDLAVVHVPEGRWYRMSPGVPDGPEPGMRLLWSAEGRFLAGVHAHGVVVMDALRGTVLRQVSAPLGASTVLYPLPEGGLLAWGDRGWVRVC